MTTTISSIESVTPETCGGRDHASPEDTLARARKLMAEAVGIDSHIDTMQWN